jgi:phospholipid/cholesterol/gamma-HCH transport system permease protein
MSRPPPLPPPAAAIAQPTPLSLALSGAWTAQGVAAVADRVATLAPAPDSTWTVDASGIVAFDTAGAWVLQSALTTWSRGGSAPTLSGLQPGFADLLSAVDKLRADRASHPAPPAVAPPGRLETVGRGAVALAAQAGALLAFVGDAAVALAACVAEPRRIRGRAILFNIRSAGFDALPIVGLLAFLLGVVVAYQGADQLRRYGANIFVADLVGVSMLREFAPLITAIIVAGRSGSAYAAQIGTMTVTEEIDALRTLGIMPMELLVLPKLVAMVIALPLLTVFADGMGVAGGMLMARSQLGVGFDDFLDRFVKAVSVTTYGVGLAKAPVFAAVIAIIGCFQGFQTHGGADSVGRQTTRSVVQAIFVVIVVDALFSVVFSILEL